LKPPPQIHIQMRAQDQLCELPTPQVSPSDQDFVT